MKGVKIGGISVFWVEQDAFGFLCFVFDWDMYEPENESIDDAKYEDHINKQKRNYTPERRSPLADLRLSSSHLRPHLPSPTINPHQKFSDPQASSDHHHHAHPTRLPRAPRLDPFDPKRPLHLPSRRSPCTYPSCLSMSRALELTSRHFQFPVSLSMPVFSAQCVRNPCDC